MEWQRKPPGFFDWLTANGCRTRSTFWMSGLMDIQFGPLVALLIEPGGQTSFYEGHVIG